MITVGSKVEHILSKDWLLVLHVSKDKDGVYYECRKKDLGIVYLQDFEVRLVK